MTAETQNGKLRVLLSEAETIVYNIDGLFFGDKEFETERALQTLFAVASKTAGYKTYAKKMAIEIYPVFSGGCEVWFIPKYAKLQLNIRKSGKYAAEFLDSERLFCFIETLFDGKFSCDSKLYGLNGRYRLELTVEENPAYIKSALAGFADKILTDKLQIAVTHEYWKLLSPNAVNEIGKILKNHIHLNNLT
jgi:hypothetical protein